MGQGGHEGPYGAHQAESSSSMLRKSGTSSTRKHHGQLYKQVFTADEDQDSCYSDSDMSNAPEIQPMALEPKDKVLPIHNELADEDPVDHNKKGVNTQMDDAAAILAAAGERDFSLDERKRVLRRIDIFVCLPMCIVYLLQQLDKQTVSNAAVFDLRESTGLTGTEYPWLTSGVYVMQLVCQPLSSYALIVFPVKYWVMFNMISWSIVTACTAAATNFTGLIIARLLLGAFEATILPSFGKFIFLVTFMSQC